jgi:small-conductance mechanosensitive channel
MANDGAKPWEQQVRDVAARVEEELHRVVTYINDQVVPDIRRDGTQALRAAAEQLQKLAQRMDDHRAAAQQQTPPTPPAPDSDKDKPQP